MKFKYILPFISVVSVIALTFASCNTDLAYLYSEVMAKQLPNKLFVDFVPDKIDVVSFYSTSYMTKVHLLLDEDYIPPIREEQTIIEFGASETGMLLNSGLNLSGNEHDLFKIYIDSQKTAYGTFDCGYEPGTDEFFWSLFDTIEAYQFADKYGIESGNKDELIKFVKEQAEGFTLNDSFTKFFTVFYAANYLEITVDAEIINKYIESVFYEIEKGGTEKYTYADVSNISIIVDLYDLSIKLPKKIKEELLAGITLSYTDVTSLYIHMLALKNFNEFGESEKAETEKYVKLIDDEYRLDDGTYQMVNNMSFSMMATCGAVYISDLLNEELPDKDIIAEYVKLWYDNEDYKSYIIEDLYYYYMLSLGTGLDTSEKVREYLTYYLSDYNFEENSVRELFFCGELMSRLNMSAPKDFKETYLKYIELYKSRMKDYGGTFADIARLLILNDEKHLDTGLDLSCFNDYINDYNFSNGTIVDIFYYCVLGEKSIVKISSGTDVVLDGFSRRRGFLNTMSDKEYHVYPSMLGLEAEAILEGENIEIVY